MNVLRERPVITPLATKSLRHEGKKKKPEFFVPLCLSGNITRLGQEVDRTCKLLPEAIDRALKVIDVIIAGAVIFSVIMEMLDVKEITMSRGGMRYGVLLSKLL